MLMLMLMLMMSAVMDDFTDSDDCHSYALAPPLLLSPLLYFSHLLFSYQSSMLTVPFHQPFISFIVLSPPLFSSSPPPRLTPFRNIFVRFEIHFGFLTTPRNAREPSA